MSDPLSPFRHRIRLTWAGLWADALLPAIWPAASLALALWALVALGAVAQINGRWLGGLAALAGLVVVGLLIWGFRRFRAPTRAQAIARLDQTVAGQPLNALTDQPATATDPLGQAIWQAHLARMQTAATATRAPAPDLTLRHRDPYALRLMAATLAMVAILFGQPAQITQLWRAQPPADQTRLPPTAWEGWIRPPAYTSYPSIYLNAVTAEALEVPAGSQVLLRFYGAPEEVALIESVSGQERTAPAETVEFPVTQHGQIQLGPRTWIIAALPDLAPQIALTKPPERQADGRMTLNFAAEDDYAVLSGQAVIALDLANVTRHYGLAIEPEPRPPLTLDLPLPISGSRKVFTQELVEDLSKHPFANLPVTVTLSASDAAPQTTQADTVQITLPGKRFFDPMAAAVAELRRDLLWSVENAPQTARLLRALTHLPDTFLPDERNYLRLRVVIRRLEQTEIDRDALAEELWAIALSLEGGDLSSALERLKRAQDRLDQAMKEGASPSEIDALMEELREAMDNYLDHLAREGEREPDQQMSDLEGMEMTGDQLQQMLDELQSLMEQGRMAEAAELMALLRELMENMQVTQGQGGQGSGQGRMRDLADGLRDQQELSDEAFRDLQDRYDNAPETRDEGERSLADRQGDLRNRLRALGQTELPADGSELAQSGREALDRADQAMREAEEALRNDDLPRALDRQSQAMEALREGLRDFAQAMEGERQDSPRAEQGGARDPLGRAPGQGGPSQSQDPMLDGHDPHRRALDLLQELRKRSGDLERSEEERDYLRRLLRNF